MISNYKEVGRVHHSAKIAGWLLAGLVLLVSAALLTFFTWRDLQPLPQTLALADQTVSKPQLLDRHQRPLNHTYANRWNSHDLVDLHQIPVRLQQAFVISEDQRFFSHHGVDWLARIHALWQNLWAGRKVRGASTITEQVVRLLHPRPRTIWSRWLEGIEAQRLELQFDKLAILEFYLNQVPFTAQRRGVVQATYYYFDRDLGTLSIREMLALVVAIRAPARFNLWLDPEPVNQAVLRLALQLGQQGKLSEEELSSIVQGAEEKIVHWQLARPEEPVNAYHFANYVYGQLDQQYAQGKSAELLLQAAPPYIQTTLDTQLQRQAQMILDQQLLRLKSNSVNNGALLVVDHQAGEILAWVVAGKPDPEQSGSLIDAVRVARQPGSTLKPFIYGLALEQGWTAATLIDDAPLQEQVGQGLHDYRNYSRHYYGLVTLREALANSLNIPAVKALQFVGSERLLQRLRQLGVESLQEHPNLYGDGLALGNGELTLYELVQAYAALANRGLFRPLNWQLDQPVRSAGQARFSPEVSSLLGNVLADPGARELEFGRGNSLNIPVQTAVKTGTSSDYHDAWTLGFNHRYLIGVWMGNLDRTPMDGITGSTGPAFVLRALFNELNRFDETRPLFLSPRLVQQAMCIPAGLPVVKLVATSGACHQRDEWFIDGTQSDVSTPIPTVQPARLRRPSNGLLLAMDPRIPDNKEAFEFLVEPQPGLSSEKRSVLQRVDWFLNGQRVASTTSPSFLWSLQRGEHELYARVSLAGLTEQKTSTIKFRVK